MHRLQPKSSKESTQKGGSCLALILDGFLFKLFGFPERSVHAFFSDRYAAILELITMWTILIQTWLREVKKMFLAKFVLMMLCHFLLFPLPDRSLPGNTPGSIGGCF